MREWLGNAVKGRIGKEAVVTQLKHCRHLPEKAEEDTKQSGLPVQYVHACVRMWTICIYAFKFALKWQS